MSLANESRFVRVKGKNPKTNRMKTVLVSVPASEPAENAPSYFEQGQELIPPYEFTDGIGEDNSPKPISEEEDQELKNEALKINESMSTMPPFSRELSTNTNMIFEALSLGISDPFDLSVDEIQRQIQFARKEGKKENPYIDRKKWESVFENCRSVTPKQEAFLEKLHVYCDEPLTVQMASNIIDKILEREFPCPHCKKRISPDSETCEYCENDLDDWALEVTFYENGKISIETSSYWGSKIIPLIDAYKKKNKKNNVSASTTSDSGKKWGNLGDRVGCGCLIFIVIVLFSAVWWIFS